MMGTGMSTMETVVFGMGVVWGPGLVMMAYLLIPSRRRQAD
jgi:hypothetical protein